MIRIILLFLCLLFNRSSFSQEKENWHLKKNEEGITVYSRKTINSDFKEVKSIVYLKTSLMSVVALITDWESYPQWVYKCGKSKILKRINSTELIHYQNIEAPWPVEDRDFVVNVKVNQNKETKIVTITSVSNPNYIPPVENHIRVNELHASWTLIPLKGGMVQIIFQILVNPGGSVPAWLVNLESINGPYQTMLHLKDWGKRKKYQEANLPFIKELN